MVAFCIGTIEVQEALMKKNICEMISIIIPVYNCEKYVERIFDCVSHQTYTDWELIFVDDGSIDKSPSLCEACLDADDRVRVIHQENKGASMARRVGIKNAKGEYLVFIDCDDIVEEDYVERLWICLMENGDVKVAACDMVSHNEGVMVEIDKSKSVCLLKEDELQKRFFQYDFWGFWGKIYHKSVFEDVYFPIYTINEDYVVMAQIFDKYKKMIYLPVPLYHYINHGESLSHQRLSKRMFDEYYNKVWVRNFYEKHNPKFLKHAESQLMETCVKLLRCIKRNDINGSYSCENEVIRKCLRDNVLKMLVNKYLSFGTKVIALTLVW